MLLYVVWYMLCDLVIMLKWSRENNLSIKKKRKNDPKIKSSPNSFTLTTILLLTKCLNVYLYNLSVYNT